MPRLVDLRVTIENNTPEQMPRLVCRRRPAAIGCLTAAGVAAEGRLAADGGAHNLSTAIEPIVPRAQHQFAGLARCLNCAGAGV